MKRLNGGNRSSWGSTGSRGRDLLYVVQPSTVIMEILPQQLSCGYTNNRSSKLSGSYKMTFNIHWKP